MHIVPRTDTIENFDLVTADADRLAQLGNQYVIQPRLDAFGIGRTVEFSFSDVPSQGSAYTIDDFEADRLAEENSYSPVRPWAY